VGWLVLVTLYVKGVFMATRLFWHRLLVLPLVVGLCLVLAGCGGGKITKENANKIKPGMSEKEVTDILGPPGEAGGGLKRPELGDEAGEGGGAASGPKEGKTTVWKDGSKSISVTFVDGKVKSVATSGL
jgi:hypothetical protein